MFKYRLPNKKKWLLTKEFLTTFKEELDKVFGIKGEENPTYWNTYAGLDGTSGFYTALEVASEKHNVKKAIYEYASKMPWYLADQFDSELTIMMYQKGVIEEGSVEETDTSFSEEELYKKEKNGEIRWIEEVEYFNGYYVTRREWEFVK